MLCVISAFGAEINWGPTTKGLQLGIKIETSSSTKIYLFLRNTSDSAQHIQVGHQSQSETFRNFQFLIRTENGNQYTLMSKATLNALQNGIMLPEIVAIQPGTIAEFKYSEDDFMNFPDLNQEIQQITVALESAPHDLLIREKPYLWIGKLLSQLNF